MKHQIKAKKVLFLKGGWNNEREVSLDSAKGCKKALRTLGYPLFELDLKKRDLIELFQVLQDFKPDVVFLNALHGRWVEDGQLQSIFELMQIPYTGSGPLSSQLCMDKPSSLALMERSGLPVPKGFVISYEDARTKQALPFPYVLKPINEGSSVGVKIIQTQADLKTVEELKQFSKLLAEEYIPGKELSIAVMNGKAINVLELEPLNGFYDYKHKYTDGQTVHHLPARISQEALDQVMSLSADAYNCLGCEGVARVDVRFDDTKPNVPPRPVILEVNTLPGMTELSIVPEVVASKGISFTQLIEWMVENPRCPE